MGLFGGSKSSSSSSNQNLGVEQGIINLGGTSNFNNYDPALIEKTLNTSQIMYGAANDSLANIIDFSGNALTNLLNYGSDNNKNTLDYLQKQSLATEQRAFDFSTKAIETATGDASSSLIKIITIVSVSAVALGAMFFLRGKK